MFFWKWFRRGGVVVLGVKRRSVSCGAGSQSVRDHLGASARGLSRVAQPWQGGGLSISGDASEIWSTFSLGEFRDSVPPARRPDVDCVATCAGRARAGRRLDGLRRDRVHRVVDRARV